MTAEQRTHAENELRRARPTLAPEATLPNQSLFESVTAVARDAVPVVRAGRSPQSIGVGLGLATAAVITAALLIAGNNTPNPSLDIALVKATSAQALAHSGRAVVDFESTMSGGMGWGTSGVSRITFSGNNLEMRTAYGPNRDGTPGFSTHHKSVDGEIYLYDGPIGHRRWIHDTNERGVELFTADPRTLLDVLDPSADFELVGTTDGVRHLRATRVASLPSLNLGLGPNEVSGDEVRKLELWIGDDNVVQRFELSYEQTEVSEHSGARAKIVKHADGSVSKEIDPEHPGERVEYTTQTKYNVRFTDVGAPFTVEAPDSFETVAGKG